MASTSDSYADLSEREQLASATESQTEISAHHVYMELLDQFEYRQARNLTVRTDSDEIPELETAIQTQMTSKLQLKKSMKN